MKERAVLGLILIVVVAAVLAFVITGGGALRERWQRPTVSNYPIQPPVDRTTPAKTRVYPPSSEQQPPPVTGTGERKSYDWLQPGQPGSVTLQENRNVETAPVPKPQTKEVDQIIVQSPDIEWTVDNGEFDIQGNTLAETRKGTGVHSASSDAACIGKYAASVHTTVRGNVKSFQVSFINPPQGGRGEHQMSFWITDDSPMDTASGYLAVLYWDSAAWGTPSDYLSLVRVDRGTHHVLAPHASSAITRDSSQHTIRLTVDKGNLCVELDGVKKISLEDSTYSSFNRAAINSYMKYYDIDAKFSDVIITGERQ